jgi:histidinol-phosphatase (PHP family)
MTSAAPGEERSGLPQDGHVHTEWSWDTVVGSMEASCARAIDVGLPSVAFTDHADLTPWTVAPEQVAGLPDHFLPLLRTDGLLEPPALDVKGYLTTIQHCRDRFPALRILSGVELGEPHWHPARVTELLITNDFDRVLGSVHALPVAQGHQEVDGLFGRSSPDVVVKEYLREVLTLVSSSIAFDVLAHIDYALRYWPRDAEPWEPSMFEAEFRDVLSALAASGRALEVNTTIPLRPEIVGWWYAAGGPAVVFGSDAHDPAGVARGFKDAASMVESQGFHPRGDPHEFWGRSTLV